jgi:hypothetical protein
MPKEMGINLQAMFMPSIRQAAGVAAGRGPLKPRHPP